MDVGLIAACAYPASLDGPKSPRELLADFGVNMTIVVFQAPLSSVGAGFLLVKYRFPTFQSSGNVGRHALEIPPCTTTTTTTTTTKTINIP